MASSCIFRNAITSQPLTKIVVSLTSLMLQIKVHWLMQKKGFYFYLYCKMYCNLLKARFGFYCFQELSCSVNNALFCYFQSLAENDLNTFEFKSLSDAVDEIKKTIDPSNIR